MIFSGQPSIQFVLIKLFQFLIKAIIALYIAINYCDLKNTTIIIGCNFQEKS